MDVIIEASGTWKVAKESNATEEPVRDVIIHDLEDPNSFLNSGPVVLDLTGDDDDDAEIELFGDTTKVVDRKPSLLDAQGQSNNNNASKDASEEDYSSLFNISDVISLDQEIIDQAYSNLSRIPVPQDPISQTPSPRDRPAPTSTVFTVPNPSPQLSQAHALPVTSYLGRTSNQRWNTSQAPSMSPSLQVRSCFFSLSECSYVD